MSHRLIVNADDFGLSAGVNRGIIQAFERGIVTSASLMVRQPAAAAAARYAREHRALSVGLHLDLGEWIFQQGEWRPRYEVVDPTDAGAVTAEIGQQLEAFRRLAGAEPTHLDSHQHAHRHEPVRALLIEQARALSVPLRECSPSISYCGSFYGQDGEGCPLPGAISVGNLCAILAALPDGITELGCHPGNAADVETAYRSERAAEVEVLCDPRVRQKLAKLDFDLCSFRDVALPRRPY